MSFILILCSIQVFAQPNPKLTRKISIRLRNTPLPDAIKRVASAASLKYSFNNDIIPNKSITFKAKRIPVTVILDSILKGTDLRYVVQKQRIIILEDDKKSNTTEVISYSIFNGYVRDSVSGEALPGASVFIPKLKIGVSTNAYGFYALRVPKGSYNVICSYLGYQMETNIVDINEDYEKDWTLLEQVNMLDAVEVTPTIIEKSLLDEIIENEQQVNQQFLEKTPTLLGEEDIIKSLQLLPGVQSLNIGTAGAYIRGANPDQTLVLLDEAPMYNHTHFMGLLSVFNSDIVKDVQLLRGSVPAEYGGRVSSVLDIHTKEGNNQRFSGSGGVGLLTSRLSLEGPIVKGKGSFIVAGRYSYFDLLLKLVSKDSTIKNSQARFYDINAKANYKIAKNGHLLASFYYGRDVADIYRVYQASWGNITASLRWNQVFGKQVFSNMSLVYSNYEAEQGEPSYEITSGIQSVHLKENIEHYVLPMYSLQYGLDVKYRHFTPLRLRTDSLLIEKREQSIVEAAIYTAHKIHLHEKLWMNIGFRLSNFSNLGTGNYLYEYDAQKRPLDSIYYHTGVLISSYTAIEPRLTIAYNFMPQHLLQFAYARMHQNLQLPPNAPNGFPTSVWFPSSKQIKPQIADQVTLSYLGNFWDKRLRLSVELYYRIGRNQLTYRDNSNWFTTSNDVEQELISGKSEALGAEFMLQASINRFQAILSYTLASVELEFEETNYGQPYPARQDQRHNIALSLVYQYKKWDFSLAWVLGSGPPITLPNGQYNLNGKWYHYYEKRNSYRLPPQHHLDFSVTYHFNRNKEKATSLNFTLYNVYGQQNPLFVFVDPAQGQPDKLKVTQISLFSVLPSINFRFKF
ncbi:MAG: TonB-dependent receptor [Aureispira sp.]|nr:TonB-dependent receptor [Aureispira sp.]